MNIAWPPAYQVRHSKKAKNIHVQIRPRAGLEIVLPRRPGIYRIEDILETHRKWIEKNLTKYAVAPEKIEPFVLPEAIPFRALDQHLQVRYEETNHKHIRIRKIAEGLWRVQGALQDPMTVKKALRLWLVNQAKKYLSPWLDHLSRQTGLPFQGLSIRRQSTLWGSCSVKQQINLNAKLLFLPPNIVQYVLLHELCHTRHMNHSARFWKLLTQFEPDCLLHRRALRQVAKYLPSWVED